MANIHIHIYRVYILICEGGVSPHKNEKKNQHTIAVTIFYIKIFCKYLFKREHKGFLIWEDDDLSYISMWEWVWQLSSD